MKYKHSALALGMALAGMAGSAGAIGFTQGDSTLDINGTINGFYSLQTREVAGVEKTNSAITNGLLPGWINFVFTSKVDGLDVKAHVGLAPGIDSNSQIVGLPGSCNSGVACSSTSPYSQIDTRNLYFKFGNADWGSIKIGRDIGLFGQKIVLSDMTLLGLGGNSYAGTPFNTTFGMIGHGYMYTGFQPQITYETASSNGVQFGVGIFQPSRFAGDQTKTPGVQASASYDWKGATPGSVWFGTIHQSTSGTGSFDANGVELGAKVGVGDFEATAYAFDAKGLGLATVGALYLSPFGQTKGRGYFAQGTYKFGKTKVGLNYGENQDQDGTLTQTNKFKAATLGVYYTLNKFVTLSAEYNEEKGSGADLFAGGLKTRTISLGGILFF